MEMSWLDALLEYLETLFNSMDSISHFWDSLGNIAVFMDVGISAVLLMIALVSAVCTFILNVVLYLLRAIPIFRMARKAKHPQAWLAWIPYADNYVLMTLTPGSFKLFNQDKMALFKNRLWAFLIWLILVFFGRTILALLSGVPVIGTFVSLFGEFLLLVVCVIIKYQMYNDLYRTYHLSTSNVACTVFGILSCMPELGPILRTILLWVIMNRTPVYVEEDPDQKVLFS